MKRIFIAALVMVAAFFSPAAPASANPDNYFTTLEKLGIPVTDDNYYVLLSFGLGMCVDLLTGATPQDEIASVVEGGIMPPGLASGVVAAAQNYLCPTTIRGVKA